MEKLKKNRLGQWTLIKYDSLKKAWVSSEEESSAADKLKQTHPTLAQGFFGTPTGDDLKKKRESNNSKLDSMFKELSDAQAAGSNRASKHHTDRIRDFIGSEPAGHIDLGHLYKLKQKHKQGQEVGAHGYDRFSDNDLLTAYDKHLDKGVNNLKDVYDNHGADAVKGLAHAYGSNVDPYADHRFEEFANLNKPNLKGDIEAYVNGHYGQHKNLPTQQNGNWYDPAYGTGSKSPNADKHQNNVDRKWDAMINAGGDDHDAVKELEQAVIDRGYDDFKHAHKIKD